MDKLKKILLKLLLPHPAIIAILVPVATAMLIYAFTAENANVIAVYASYFLSAYALTVVCIRIPDIIKSIRKIKTNNRFLLRYSEDIHYRMKLSLYATVAINTLYALLQLFSGIINHSMWFYALSVYYALLAIMRYFLLKETVKSKSKKDLFTELLHYRFCGILLLLMNLALGVIVFYVVWQNRGFEHHYIVTIAMAAYTFTALTKSIINVIKFRRYESPVMSAAKAISLAAALVSVLSLETAMLTAFGEQDDPVFRQIMTAATGAAVCIGILVMAIYMIIRSTKEIKSIKNLRYTSESEHKSKDLSH